MNFGQALVYLKEGHKVARAGWNGKGMYLKQFSLSSFVTVDSDPGEPVNLEDGFVRDIRVEDSFRHIGFMDDDSETFYPICDFIWLKTADNKALPWNPNNLDMMTEDWDIVK